MPRNYLELRSLVLSNHQTYEVDSFGKACGRKAAHQGIPNVLASKFIQSICSYHFLLQSIDTTLLQHTMSSIQAKWTRLASSDRLKRSSQNLSVVGDRAWIFGGELQPRQPIDNQFDVVELSESKYRGGRQYAFCIDH